MSDIEILTHEQVLAILSRKAETGSVTAAVALERALRVRAREDDQPLDDEERRWPAEPRGYASLTSRKTGFEPRTKGARRWKD